MKTVFSLVCLVLVIVASVAYSEPIRNPSSSYVAQPFNQYTGMASTARYSGVFKVDRNTSKTVFFIGYSTNKTDVLTTLPGTATLQCAVTSTGPYVTAKDRGANATTGTAATIYDLDSRCQYLRAVWTKSGAGARSISAWILYGDQ